MTFLSTVLAQTDTTVNLNAPGAAFGTSDLAIENIIQWAVTAILVVAGLIFFFMLVIGGLKWILSGGDKAATESARGQITAALIGLVIVFSAWAIATLINAIFGVNILSLTIPAIQT